MKFRTAKMLTERTEREWKSEKRLPSLSVSKNSGRISKSKKVITDPNAPEEENTEFLNKVISEQFDG